MSKTFLSKNKKQKAIATAIIIGTAPSKSVFAEGDGGSSSSSSSDSSSSPGGGGAIVETFCAGNSCAVRYDNGVVVGGINKNNLGQLDSGGTTGTGAAGVITQCNGGCTGSAAPGSSAVFNADLSRPGADVWLVYGQNQTVDSSTPFLMVWNGKNYVHENDFLFGKPNTAFNNFKEGKESYEEGIGGDTYLLSPSLVADEYGELKLQIRELEPEESFIDQFNLSALDLKKTERFIVDGDLEHSYIFDTEKVNLLNDQKVVLYHKNKVKDFKNSYTSLELSEGKGTMLQAEDEIVVRVPKSSLSDKEDTFLLVDSHYRDWTLGEQVPFSILERFSIQSAAMGKGILMALGGLAFLSTAAVAGKNLPETPYTYADVPGVPQGPGGGGGGSRSLVISAGGDSLQTYLQTLFPRYVQASQEVVRIPKEVISTVKEAYLSVRIKATKRHMVRSAFVFQGKGQEPELKKLSLTKANHHRSGNDYVELLDTKDGHFLHTIPGDIVDLVVKDIPRKGDATRRYVLQAKGFYTRMSASTKMMIGSKWLKRLAREDRKLLKRLRIG